MRRLLYLLLVLPTILFAQDDMEYWNSSGFSKKLNDKLDLNFNYGLRLENNMTTLKQQLFQASLDVDLGKVKLNFANRYINEVDERANRYQFDVRHKLNIIEGFSLDLRNRITYESNNELEEVAYWRDRVLFVYKNKKEAISPYFGAEYFYRFHHTGNFSNKYRLIGGLKYKISKRSDFKLCFIRQVDIYNKENYTTNIVRTGFAVRLK